MKNSFFKSLASLLIALIAVVSMMSLSAFAADTIKWSVSDKNVATVSKGTIKGVGVGTTTVTATVGSQKLTCKVTVYTNKIVPKSSKATATAGSTGSMDISIKGLSDVTCGTTDKTIATAKLDKENGKLKITGVKAGTCKIKVYSKSDNSISRTISVTVEKGSGTTKTKTSSSINGSVKNGAYENSYFNLKFKPDNFEFMELDSKTAGNVLFIGYSTENNGVMSVTYDDVSEYSDFSESDLALATIMLNANNIGYDYTTITKNNVKSVRIAGETYYKFTSPIELEDYDMTITIACKCYKDKVVVIRYINDEDDFNDVAKEFTKLK